MGHHSDWLVHAFGLHMIRFKPLEENPMMKKPAPKPAQKPMPKKGKGKRK